MSFSSDNLIIGLDVEGSTKYLSDVDVDELTYLINDSQDDAQVFNVKDGAKALSALRGNEPEKTFLAIPV